MAGFKKAKSEQAYIKMGFYGPTGSGKTFTTLLCAEGLAKATGKRFAFIDTEHGTDFYTQEIQARKVHPEAFDFDSIQTKSITEILEAVKTFDTDVYCALVIDSISHVWDACQAAYKGKTTKIGTLPISAWGEIKKPYKELMALLLSMPAHVFFCGRQANEFGKDDDGELTKLGVKMRAEGETQYEPHIGIRMEATKADKGKESEVFAIVEKDRTGVLAGKVIPQPNYDKMVKPLLPFLGTVQAKTDTEEEVGEKDAEAMVKAESDKLRTSTRLLLEWKANLDLASAKGKDELEKLGKQITPAVKKQMTTQHVAELRNHFLALSGSKPAPQHEEAA